MSEICTAWIAAADYVVHARTAKPARLTQSAARPNILEIFAHMPALPPCNMAAMESCGPNVLSIKTPDLPVFLPSHYANLAPLLQQIVNIQAKDLTMPYMDTAAQLVIRRAFWPKGQAITDYTGFMMDADPRLARGGEQARMISYNIHDAPSLTLGFHQVAAPASALIELKTSGDPAINAIAQAIKTHCAAKSPDLIQRAGEIMRRDELTAWGATEPTIGDGQSHHFVTVSFYLPAQKMAEAVSSTRRSRTMITPRY